MLPLLIFLHGMRNKVFAYLELGRIEAMPQHQPEEQHGFRMISVAVGGLKKITANIVIESLSH